MKKLPEVCAQRGCGTFAAMLDFLRMDVDVYIARSADYKRQRHRTLAMVSAVTTPQLLCIVLYRFSHFLAARSWRRCAVALRRLNLILHKVDIASTSCIGGGLYIPHPVSVIFEGVAGVNLTLAAKSVVMPGSSSCAGEDGNCSQLGDGVVIGGSGLVIGPAVIGDRCRLGMQAVASGDLPPDTVVIARIFRPRVAK